MYWRRMLFAWFGWERFSGCLVGGAGPQWDVPQAIGTVPKAGNYDPIVVQDFHIKFGEDGDAVVIIELPHGYE